MRCGNNGKQYNTLLKLNVLSAVTYHLCKTYALWLLSWTPQSALLLRAQAPRLLRMYRLASISHGCTALIADAHSIQDALMCCEIGIRPARAPKSTLLFVGRLVRRIVVSATATGSLTQQDAHHGGVHTAATDSSSTEVSYCPLQTVAACFALSADSASVMTGPVKIPMRTLKTRT